MNRKTLFLIFICTYSFSQENILNLNKADEAKFVLDGILSDQELENSVELEIIYEHDPGYNIRPSYKTTGYMIYTDTFLYVGFKAFRRDALVDIMKLVTVRKYAFDVEVLTIASILNKKMVVVPVEIHGDALFGIRNIVRMFVDIMGITYRLRINKWYQKNYKKPIPQKYKPIIKW